MSTLPQTPEAIVRLAARHGIRIKRESVVLNNIGLDFSVAFAEAEDGVDWVLRLPRRPDVVEKSKHEANILALVHAHLPVAVPDWKIQSDELIAYPRLTGTPGLTVEQETGQVVWHFDQKSPVFAETFAQALVALHGIDHTKAKKAGLTVMTPRDVRVKHRDNMAKVRSELGVADNLWQQWQTWLADDGFWPDFSVLVHGDLYAGHVIIDEKARVTGIIDWTEAAVGDPAADFIFHLMGFGDEGFDQLIGFYKAAGGRTWPRMKDHCRQLLSAVPLTYALYALKTQDEQHLAAAKIQLGVTQA